MQGFETAWRANLPLGFGTDLPGDVFDMQAREFLYRREIQPAAATLRSATVPGSEILGRPDLGRIAPGATADLLVVDGDPLSSEEHTHVLQAQMRISYAVLCSKNKTGTRLT